MNQNKTSYQRKLAHPNWQMKRLELFKARGLKCELCNSKDKELHIHHKYYTANTEPQDYPDDAYQVLCYKCHDREESTRALLKSISAHQLFVVDLNISAVESVAILSQIILCAQGGIKAKQIEYALSVLKNNKN